MTFYEVLDQVIELLQRHGRVTYRALKRQFDLDDDYIEDLKAEIVQARQLAVDQNGEMLVWAGETQSQTLARQPERLPLAYTPVHLAEKILHARPTLEGERKQVTVLFADIKDSTELIRGLDPEAAQQLLDPAIHRMMDAVHRFEGTVNQVLGDGIMALFGAPIAHEDHALRACYAALAMQAAMRSYTEDVRRARGLELRIRVGLNAGEVVVRAIGNDLHMDYSAVGETTHLAARMEQLATPGTIRLSAATLHLVEGLVQITALGPVPVKGLEEPVEVFELLGASSTRQRLQAAIARGLTPFVGRQQELDVLSQALARARASHGQVVALVGEAGVGKSRLVYECLHAPDLQGWRVLEAASVSYGKATPYFPVVDLLKRYAQVDDADEARTRRAKLTGHVLTLDTTLQDTLEPLLALLEALSEDSAFLHLDPPQRRQRTLEALRRLLLHESQVQPLLLVFEDLHWIDAETQALLDSLVERLPTASLLLLVNYRPEYQHGWGSKTTYTQVRLDPLEPAGAAQVVQALLGDDASLEALKQLLIERTEGNPFFLEESVRTLVETGVLAGQPGAYSLMQTLSTIRVPATVQAVLAARIDRLSPAAKQLLQTAAVIGYEVPWPLLQAIAELPEADVHRGLAQLQSAEFLYETRLFPEREFTFKHALTHEVAYSSLLQERRRVLHGRIVEAMETLASERLTEQVDRLAHHAMRGELWDKAVAYCRQAGAKSAAQSAYREAAASFEQALQASTHLPEDRETRVLGIDLRFDLRNVLAPLGDVERMLDVLRQAESLAETLGEHRRLGLVSRFMARHFLLMHEYDDAIVSGQRTLTLGTELGDFALQMAAHNILGCAHHAVGDYGRAVAAYGHVVASLEGELLYERFGLAMPPAIDTRTYLAVCFAEIGAFAEGLAHAQTGLRLAEAIDHAFGLTQAYWAAGAVRLRQGAFPEAVPLLERALGICQDANVMLHLADTTASLGYAYALCGRIVEALPLMEQAVQQSPVLRGMEGQALRLVYLSEVYLLADRLQEARALAQQAYALSQTYKERRCEAYALYLLGEIATHGEPADAVQAEASYQQALALTEELGMRPLLAHCHRRLGTLYATLGQPQQARHGLSAAIDLYRAMDMTFWLPGTETALTRVM